MKYGKQILSVVLLSILLSTVYAIEKVPVTEHGKTGVYDPTVARTSENAEGRIFVESEIDESVSVGSQSEAGTISILSLVGSPQLMRWPSHGRPMTTMDSNTTYFRDPFIGLRYTVTAASDGDNWFVKFTQPVSDGSDEVEEIIGPELTYYEEVGGYPSCFYSPGWLYYICGTRSITITTTYNTQCEAAGAWTAQVYENGAAIGAVNNFTMMAEVPPEDMEAPLNQQGNAHGYDSMCYYSVKENLSLCPISEPLPEGATRFTISQKGCAMTAAAMVAEYHGANVGSSGGLEGLNDWLDGNNGFHHNINTLNLGNIIWPKVAEYGRLKGGSLFYKKGGAQNDAELRTRICTNGAQVLAVRNSGHFVTVVGRDGVNPDDPWKIVDPWGGVSETNLRDARGGQYANTYNSARYYENEKSAYPFPIYGFEVYLYSPAELLIEGPGGAKTGIDPVTGVEYQEILGAAYYEEGIDDDETGTVAHRTKIFTSLGTAVDGDYKVDVIGTDAGTYDLEVITYDQLGNMKGTTKIQNVPTSEGQKHSYNYAFSTTDVTATTKLSGGFDGGGQRPRDVDKFLSYSNPSESRTSLPLGTTEFRLAVSYGDTVDVGAFYAELEGVDITALFNPIAGESEVITIPITTGQNVLKLTIDGTVESGRIATDSDRLVFIVK